jgi:hypothetical protein
MADNGRDFGLVREEEKWVQGTGFWWKSLKDRGRLEDIGIEWRIILKDYLK